MENKKNQIKVSVPSSTMGLQISTVNTKQVIEATNNRAQYYADLAKKYRDEAKQHRDNAKFYSEQNSDVTVEYIDNLKADLYRKIDTQDLRLEAKFEQELEQKIPKDVSELNNDIPYVPLNDFENMVKELELPSQTNCEGMFLSTDGVNEYWKPIPVSLAMFDTILKDHILTYEESKGLALQGTYVYKEAIAGSRYGYPDFYNKVVEEYNEASQEETVNGVTVKVHSNGHKFYNIADKSDIDEYFSVIGTAWFYGVDTEKERVFLPRNNWFEQATGDIAEVGLSIEAGLPNIEARLNQILFYGNSGASGAILKTGTQGSHAGAGSSQKTSDIEFNASLSNSIYGNSDTVQPNAVKKLLYICVGNTTNYEGVTNVINQGMEILEQVNQGIETRVKLDGSNARFTYITETFSEGTSWYRVYSDGWCEQGGVTSAAFVTFLKPFANTSYSVTCTFSQANTDLGKTGHFFPVSKTTTTMSRTYGTVTVNWKACGYIA